MMNFERLSAPFRVRCSLRVLTVCGTCFHLVFCVFLAARAQGPNAKIDTLFMRKPVFFKVRAGAGRATGKATDDQKRQQK